MNIFTSQEELKKWAIAMANACGGVEVTTNNIFNKQNPKKSRKAHNKICVRLQCYGEDSYGKHS